MESDEELMRVARKRAQDKVGFYVHFTIYVVVNLWLIFIWWYTGDGFPWFAIVLVLWGIGLVANFVTAFMGTGVTDRMAEREFQKLKQGKE